MWLELYQANLINVNMTDNIDGNLHFMYNAVKSVQVR